MPNWASNMIEVTGPENEIKRFIDFVRTEETTEDQQNVYVRILDLNKLCPMPPSLAIGNVPSFPKKSKEELEKIILDPNTDNAESSAAVKELKMIENFDATGFPSWYEWRIKSWGTKWNIDTDCEWNHIGERATLCYDSAWSPPIEAISEGSKLFPELIFTNYAMDPAMDWACQTDIQNGVMDDNCATIEEMKHVTDLLGYEEEMWEDEDCEEKED